MSDFADRRTMMVDTQVRPSDVTKFPIIDAMLTIPREHFVPDAFRETAYMGEHVPLDASRVVLDPRVLAKMLEAVNVQAEDLVLDIGSGLGYSAAVIAHVAEAVVALEDDTARVADAEKLLSENETDNVAVVQGPLSHGAAKHGPYDAIIIEGGVEIVPEAIVAQLKEGGRIVAIFEDGHLGTAKVGHLNGGTLSWRDVFNADAPLLPGFERAREFVL